MELESGECAVGERDEAVVAEVEPAQVNEISESTCLDERDGAVAHVQVLQPGDDVLSLPTQNIVD